MPPLAVILQEEDGPHVRGRRGTPQAQKKEQNVVSARLALMIRLVGSPVLAYEQRGREPPSGWSVVAAETSDVGPAEGSGPSELGTQCLR